MSKRRKGKVDRHEKTATDNTNVKRCKYLARVLLNDDPTVEIDRFCLKGLNITAEPEKCSGYEPVKNHFELVKDMELNGMKFKMAVSEELERELNKEITEIAGRSQHH